MKMGIVSLKRGAFRERGCFLEKGGVFLERGCILEKGEVLSGKGGSLPGKRGSFPEKGGALFPYHSLIYNYSTWVRIGKEEINLLNAFRTIS